MKKDSIHSFHIPVMGLAYTIDSPIRVAHYGIDSVISIVDDELIHKMDEFYSQKFSLPFKSISAKVSDYRAKRITSYLNNVERVVKKKYDDFCIELSNCKESLSDFIDTLPQISNLKRALEFYYYSPFNKSAEIFSYLRNNLKPGAIDVNIMTKVDKTNYHNNQPLPAINNDAHASLRGFALSNLSSGVVLSAGLNPSLYSYISEFIDFLPNAEGVLKKKVILKVSDFRSAMIQGSFLAKKGVWVSEYRIESGLNCGGHAFATDGLLLGPIAQEFKQRRGELIATVKQLVTKAWESKGVTADTSRLEAKFTIQGGVGTAAEHEFLLQHYDMDSVGWGSPFLLVSEATATDAETQNLLASATEPDFYRSNISPLGVPFNTVKGTSNETIKNHRIAALKAGSSCPKKLLALSKEYDEQGICTASRKYQQIKLQELIAENGIERADFTTKCEDITVKSCLCVGLANPAYMVNQIAIKGEQQGVVVCPGPNLAYFDKKVSLKEMVQHIYGYKSVLANGSRPSLFMKELQLYVEYFLADVQRTDNPSPQQIKKWQAFKDNLLEGIIYYKNLFEVTKYFGTESLDNVMKLNDYKVIVNNILFNTTIGSEAVKA